MCAVDQGGAPPAAHPREHRDHTLTRALAWLLSRSRVCGGLDWAMRAKRAGYALAALALILLAAFIFVRMVLGSDAVRTTMEVQLAARLGQPVRIGAARAVLFPRVAGDLDDVAIGSPAAVRLGTVRMVTGLRGLLSRTIVDAEVIVMDSRITLPLPFPLIPAGDPSATPAAAGGTFTVQSVRLLSLQNITLGSEGGEVLVDLESSIEGDRLEISRLTARAGNTTIEGTGELTSIERLQGRLEARIEVLDLAELLAIASALTGGGPAGEKARGGHEADPMRMDVALTAARGRFGTYEFDDLSARVGIVPARVLLEEVSVRIFGGSLHGGVDVDPSGRAPRLRMTGRFEGLDVARLLEREAGGSGVTGRAGGTLSITATGADADALMRSARGNVTAAVTNGTIQGMDMVRAVVLAFGRPSGAPPEGTGSVFTRLGGTFTLAGASVSSENLALESRDFDMAGAATVNLVTGAVKATANVVLSPELTAQAGTDLRRYAGEDGRVVVPATISGTLERTRISLDIAAAAKRAIGNELRRRTKSLLDDLFRRPGER